MAWKEITEPNENTRTFLADAAADVTAVGTAAPDAPVGSVIIVGDDDGDGTAAVYAKLPAGSFSKLFSLG